VRGLIRIKAPEVNYTGADSLETACFSRMIGVGNLQSKFKQCMKYAQK